MSEDKESFSDRLARLKVAAATGNLPADLGAWAIAELAARGERANAKEWPVVVELQAPIEIGKSTVTRIELRRGRLGDIKGFKLSGQGLDTEQMFLVASRLSGQPVGVIERLDMDDSSAVMAAVMDFYGRCLGVGSEP